jgi:hypothetical protein
MKGSKKSAPDESTRKSPTISPFFVRDPAPLYGGCNDSGVSFTMFDGGDEARAVKIKRSKPTVTQLVVTEVAVAQENKSDEDNDRTPLNP